MSNLNLKSINRMQLKEREPMDRKQIPVKLFNPKRPGALTTSKGNLRMISFFSKKTECPACRGTGMSKGVGDIHIADHTLAEVDKLPILEILTFIKSLRQSMDTLEFGIVSPIVSHIELMLLYLSKIGLRTLPPVTARGGLPVVSS